MAENLTVARPYAEAAFALAKASGRLPAWQDALARLAAAASEPRIAACFTDPRLSPERIAALIATAAGDLDAEQRNFVALLVENRRLAVLPEIHRLFEALKDEAEKVQVAEVVSAFPLSETQLADLTAALERRLAVKVKARVRVDPELIGGVKIAIGDEVIDASVRGKLDAMATMLKN